MTRKSRRVVVLSDFHSGHIIGLTHPDWNPTYRNDSLLQKLSRSRTDYYRFYHETIKSLRPIDILILNGDMIDTSTESRDMNTQRLAELATIMKSLHDDFKAHDQRSMERYGKG